ncbi:xanthine dehydrogenase small subunit [Terrabacter carboxydivorans]|uniref:FAD binding domain-containing protein n=1 Tax=Terrabacter carboxydivorans TaxID=619730 RepID=A0ABN3M847_9MICO
MTAEQPHTAQHHTVRVNGADRSLSGVEPATNALDWLRGQGLTGAKEGCAEGECGACAVLVARSDGATGTEWTALNACLVPAAALDGQEVVTAEGLGTPTRLHPVQHEMAVRGGSQCGYCTPGFVCSMAAEYYRDGRVAAARPAGPGAHALQACGPNGFDLEALSGNLCRCTGYRPIRDAAWALGEPRADDPLAVRRAGSPPEATATRLEGRSGTYARPADLAEALALLAEHPEAVLVAGSTDRGVEVNLRGARSPFVIGIDRLPELRGLTVTTDAVEIGAALTLTEVERALAGRVPLLDEVFPQFASRLIRNGATIGGNIGTGSPIGDLPPALLALEAVVVLVGAEGEREVAMADYFTGYRQSVRRADELVRAVRIPLPLAGTTAFHKIAKRRFDDISSVAVAFALDVVDGVVQRARIGLGGVAATPVRALATEAALEGRAWSADTVQTASEVMETEGTPLDDHRASAAYRRAVLGTALQRLHAETAADAVGATHE